MIPWMGGSREPQRSEPDSTASSFDFGMTDLEERLRGPEAERVRADLLERFSALDAQLRVLMSTGVAPQAFNDVRQVREAVAHARKIVAAFR